VNLILRDAYAPKLCSIKKKYDDAEGPYPIKYPPLKVHYWQAVYHEAKLMQAARTIKITAIQKGIVKFIESAKLGGQFRRGKPYRKGVNE